MTAGAAGRANAVRTAEAAGWIRGAAQALHVLSRRPAADRLRAADFATALLARAVEPANWHASGLPGQAPRQAGADGADGADRIPIRHPAVLHVARTAMSLRCSTVPAARRPAMWARLTGFFEQVHGRQAGPVLRRMQDSILFSRVNAGDHSPEVVTGLLGSYEWFRDTFGGDAYLTSISRTNLAIAYRERGAGTDLAEATDMCRRELGTRTRRYGGKHPFTLVARNLLARCLLAQGEATADHDERRALAREAYAEADLVRVARDQIYGIRSVNAILSRRYQGHALLLLGEPEQLARARACLRHALAFETAQNDNAEWPGSGQTHLLLARACLALSDIESALGHARDACRLLRLDAPRGQSYRDATALLRQLTRMQRDGSATGS